MVPGTYKVREVAQAGWTQSYPALGYYEEVFSSSTVLTDNDFGNWAPASKAGTKFEDLDNDGAAREAGEPGLEGWTIYADINGNSTFDPTEPNDVTDANGAYLISGLTPGSYTFREVTEAGWTCTYPNPCEWAVTLDSQEADTGNDFGNFRPATKSGTKFEDLDADGAAQEAGEPGLPGWVIYVDYDDDGVLDAGEPSATTDANGDYTITGVVPGTYKVREVAQAGWTQSYPALGYYEEVFSSSTVLTDNDFGNWAPASKAGTKFEDLDNDGAAREAGEPGLEGWTIYADINGNSTFDPTEPNDVTDANGAYLISGLTPGSYTFREVGQTDWTCTYPNPCEWAVTLTSRQADTGNDFGNFKPSGAGCTPGFWQGGFGSQLWDTVNDPDWTAEGGVGTNPFIQTTLFNSYFTPVASLNGESMLDIVGIGGGSSPARKAARDVVAATLNASFGIDYGYTPQEIADMWTDAVTNNTFKALHDFLAPLNERGCTI